MIQLNKSIDLKAFDVRVAVFDFDGTLSTLRNGWEPIMKSIMLSQINPEQDSSPDLLLEKEVEDYIAYSTGIQTVEQMQWLVDKIESYGKAVPRDVWYYKELYNKALLEMVDQRLLAISRSELSPEDFHVPGSIELIRLFKAKGIDVYIASGTDDIDIKNEAKLLGFYDYCTEIKGAPYREFACSKEAVMSDIISKYAPENVVVIGDGKVEIELGNKHSALTIGTATNESLKDGSIFEPKLKKLTDAGADVIIPDFNDKLFLEFWC